MEHATCATTAERATAETNMRTSAGAPTETATNPITAAAAPEAPPLDRPALYAAAWKEPLHVLAPRYGMSGRGLAKLCERYRIPVPGRGYWARVKAGQSPRRSPLPPLTAVGKGAPLLAPPVLTPRAAPAPPPHESAAIAEARTREADLASRIVVPDDIVAISRLHPTLAAWKRTWRARHTADVHAGVGPDVRVSEAQRDRAILLLHTLFTALETRGYRVEARMPRPKVNDIGARQAVTSWPSQAYGRATCVAVDDQDVLLILRETEQRVAQAESSRRSLFDPRRVMVPSGRLVLTIPHHVGGWGQFLQWADPRGAADPERRLEAQLNDVVVGVVEAAEEFRRVEAMWLERVRERERTEAAERDRARRRAQNEALEREAERQAESWKRARLLRAFVASPNAAATLEAPQGMTTNEWVAWIKGYADRLSPMPTPNGAEAPLVEMEADALVDRGDEAAPWDDARPAVRDPGATA